MEWHVPPWEVDGLRLTPWRRYVWLTRRRLYMTEFSAKQRRDREEAERRTRQR